jgi:PAS domain S-box-containing protein
MSSISQQIEAVYRRALTLRDRAKEQPIKPELLEESLKELYFVLEELHAVDEELHQQNLALAAAQFEIDAERQRYRTLFDLAPDGYLVTDKQGKIHHANQAAAQLLAVPQTNLIGKPFIVFIDQSDRPQFQQRLLQPQSHQAWEVTLQSRHNQPVTLSITTNYLKDKNRSSRTILWSLRDISDRYRMEQALQTAYDDLERQVAIRTTELVQANAQLQKEIEERQQAEQTIRYQAHLIDVSTDAIYVMNRDQTITFWNRGAENLYGWTAAEAVGQNAIVFFGQPETPEPIQTDWESGTCQREVRHQTKTGQPVTVLSRQTRVDDDTLPTSTLVVNTDITEKKKLEADFLQVQRLESLGILARSIAHDLNNILMPISVVPHFLLNRLPNLDTATQDLLKSIQQAAKRGAALSNQILLFAGKPQGDPVLVQINDLFREIYQFTQHSFPKNIEVQITITDSLEPVLADTTLLYQVLLNLCVNARDAMPAGGTLSLSADKIVIENNQTVPNARPGNYVVITVADTGTGIPPEVVDHIFDPLFTTKPAGQGSGLGLSTAVKIVKDYKGFIQVTNVPGAGCRFQVYLPADRDSVPPSAVD